MLPVRGVTTPVNQGTPPNEGAANTVINAMRVETIVVEYFDGEGRRQQNTLLKMGDEYYTADNSLAWTRSLKRVNPWLRDGVQGKLPIAGPVVVQDSVDVMPRTPEI